MLFEQALQALTIPGRNTIDEPSIGVYYMQLELPSLEYTTLPGLRKHRYQEPTYYQFYQNNGLYLNLINQTLQMYFLNNKINPLLKGQQSNLNIREFIEYTIFVFASGYWLS